MGKSSLSKITLCSKTNEPHTKVNR